MKNLLSFKRTITLFMVSIFMFCIVHSQAQTDPICNQLIESTKTFFKHLEYKNLNISELDKLSHDESIYITGNGTIQSPPTASGKRDFTNLKLSDALIINEIKVHRIDARKFDDNVVSVFGNADFNLTRNGITKNRNETFSIIYSLKKDGTWHIVNMHFTYVTKD